MNPAEPWIVTMMPAVIGSMSRPDVVADSPELICRNVGMNAIAENMPSPTARPSAVATTKVGLRNSVIGMIGSTARSSTATKTHAATKKPASSDKAHPRAPKAAGAGTPLPRAPAVAAAEVGEQDQAGRRRRERHDAGVVQRRG